MQTLLNSLSAWHLKTAFHEVELSVLGHPEIVKRIRRAYEILTVSKEHEYEITLVETMPVEFVVQSPNDIYHVIPSQQSCTCPDSEKLCKHRLAVKILLKAFELQNEEKKSKVQYV